MRLNTYLSTYRNYKRLARTGLFAASPPAVLAGGFALLIILGTLLLWLPWSTRVPIGFFKALFTATSAVTVTGLAVVDTSTAFTPLGQLILMALVQIGGLGFVTLAVVAAMTLGKRFSLQQQAVALEAFNQTSVSKIRSTALGVLRITLAIEAVGALILALWWIDDGLLGALWHGAYHTVMAFNNAGMSMPATSMARYLSDPVVVLTTTVLVILGGIGFPILQDIRTKRSWSKLSAYSRIILLGTLALNAGGFVAIWVLEFRNPGTLGGLPAYTQALAAWLQSVSVRTAGFQAMDMSQLSNGGALVLMLLMFIGGGSLSTASGIKVGTFIVLIAAASTYIRGRTDIVLLRRTIAPDVVHKALALLLLTSALAFGATLLMCLFEPRAHFLDIVFEVIAALSTTGLTRALTPQLSSASHVLLIVLMFVGRLGPLTLVYSLSTRSRGRIRYPETQFQVG